MTGQTSPPSALQPLPHAPEQGRSWLETIGVLGLVIAILAAATGVGSLAAGVVDWHVAIDTPQARPAGALETFQALRLAVFLAAFQLATLVLTSVAARLFRGGRVTFLALSAPGGALAASFTFSAVLIVGAAIYAGAVLSFDRNALLGDVRLLADMLRTDVWWMIALAAVVGAPIAEEVLFRGLMYGVLRTSPFGKVAAAAITAIVWASVHAQYSLYGIFGIALIGLYLAWVREKTGGLLAPIICHAAYNASVLAVMMLVPERLTQMG
ncbi:MAG: CPBP family intramembrane metalloprotease [Hyphomicrobium sp.]|nr:CPBP family intramembrane metalloprotease [Hyphomicrobium sp.]